MNAFPLIEISGNAYKRGVQYGEQAKHLISKSVEIYQTRLEIHGSQISNLSPRVGKFIDFCSFFSQDHIDEIRGIAAGASLSFEEVLLINLRTEIVADARRDHNQSVAKSDGCTGVIVLPARSASRKLIHAQNWDWLDSCKETGIVIRVLPEDGIPFLTFTEAGGLARSGLNAAGISITANYLESDRDFQRYGVPLPFIRRQVLEHRHLAFAIRDIATTPKSCSNNMMLAHRDGWCTSFECAPDESFMVEPENGLLVHANHWVSAVAQSKLVDTGLRDSPDSLYRQSRVWQILEAKKLIDREDVMQALSDKFGSPFSVCRDPSSDEDDEVFSTVATIMIDSTDEVMEICKAPYENTKFATYSLTR